MDIDIKKLNRRDFLDWALKQRPSREVKNVIRKRYHNFERCIGGHITANYIACQTALLCLLHPIAPKTPCVKVNGQRYILYRKGSSEEITGETIPFSDPLERVQQIVEWAKESGIKRFTLSAPHPWITREFLTLLAVFHQADYPVIIDPEPFREDTFHRLDPYLQQYTVLLEAQEVTDLQKIETIASYELLLDYIEFAVNNA